MIIIVISFVVAVIMVLILVLIRKRKKSCANSTDYVNAKMMQQRKEIDKIIKEQRKNIEEVDDKIEEFKQRMGVPKF